MARGKAALVDMAAAEAERLTGVVDGLAAASSPSSSLAYQPQPAAVSPRARPEAMALDTLSRRAQLPGPVRFALVVVLSFSISALGHVFLNESTQGEMESIARQPSTKELALFAGWRLFAITLGWLGDFDGYDMAALALLSQGPAAHLISVFYGIRASAAGAYLGLDVVSAFLPFLLLRKLSGAHSAAPGVPNREIVVDRFIQVLTTLLSSLTYNVVLFLAGRAYLSDALVLYFKSIPTIKPAADAVLLNLDSPATQVLSLLFGLAARSFIFTPVVTTPQTAQDGQSEEFDPVHATLGQTVAWNLWGYTNQTKVSIKRTALAMLFTGVSTYLNCVLTITGVESHGAAVYASVWVLATMVTGLVLRFVGSAA
ncbi:hypothetical protein B0H63DRAFT_275695 [Podospora didyma]|uniref:Uncharacterized protein n=1 Tax=Podospora didyma TaxID=330526 RepID=A0AAE0NAD2_9PEZI|nr:hypothetical protein B0H63DRAFT_275695 [Podospora didyma]